MQPPEERLPLLPRMIHGLWMSLARPVAAGVRKLGPDVRPDHELRRDGTGFFLLLVAACVATVEWWALDGWFGDVVHAVAGGTFGWMALVLPVLLLIMAVRLMRHPEDSPANSRISIGLILFLASGSGLAHVIGGQPALADGFDALWAAGGMAGFLLAAPLAAVSLWLPVAVYGLLAFASILIMTATPFRHIPMRLRMLYERLMGQDPSAEAAPYQPGDGHDQSYLYADAGPGQGTEAAAQTLRQAQGRRGRRRRRVLLRRGVRNRRHRGQRARRATRPGGNGSGGAAGGAPAHAGRTGRRKDQAGPGPGAPEGATEALPVLPAAPPHRRAHRAVQSGAAAAADDPDPAAHRAAAAGR